MHFVTRTLILMLFLLAARSGAAESVHDLKPVSFSRDVSPILVKQCQTCHGPDKSKGKFRLDTFARLNTGGKSRKKTVVAGKPGESELFRLITSHDDDERMPQDADPLPAPQIEVIRKWIEQGAKYDGTDPSVPLASLGSADDAPPPAVYPRRVPITALAYSPDGKRLAASGYHEVTLWDAAGGKLLGRIDHLPERVCSIAWSSDGKHIAVAGGTPGLSGELVLCDADSSHASAGKVLDRIADLMLVVRFSPDGKKLAAGGADNAVKIYDAESGKRLVSIEQHADWITDLAFSPDGSQIATASRDRSARVFDAATGEMKSAYLKHEDPLVAIAWADDGDHVFSASRGRTVHVWHAPDAKDAGTIAGFDSDLSRLQIGFGLLIVSTQDGAVLGYDQGKKHELERTFASAGDWIYCLAVDVHSKRIAGGCYNGQIKIWNAEDGKIEKSFVAVPGLVKER